MKFMGWAIRRGSNGTMDGVASGFREPNGIGVFGPERDVFVTDNQGHWTAVCELNHLRPGKFFGRPSSTPDSKKLYEGRGTFTPPAIWFPYSLARSISGMAEIRDNRFGPFKGQLLVGDFQNALVTRVFLEKVNGEYQGAVFSFITGFRSGVNRLSFGPDGNLYVGGLQRTWTSIAPDPASLERVTFTGRTPFSIRKVEAKPDGFLLTFTEPANPSAVDPDNFDISQFRYAYHSNYGSPRFNHAGEKGSQTPIEVTNSMPVIEVSEPQSRKASAGTAAAPLGHAKEVMLVLRKASLPTEVTSARPVIEAREVALRKAATPTEETTRMT